MTGFGQVNFAQAILVYFTLLTHLGLMTVGTREVARQPLQIQNDVVQILTLRLALAILSFILLVLFALSVPLTPTVKVLVLLFGFSLFSSAAILDWAFKGLERMRVVGVIEIFRAVPFMVLVVIWVRTPSQILRIPLMFLASTGLAALFSLAVFARSYGWITPSINLKWWRNVLRQALPLGLAFIMVQVYYLIDTILLGFLSGDVAVGRYSAAYRIITFVQGLGGWYFESVFPAMSRSYKRSPNDLPGFLNASTVMTTLVAIPLAIVGTVLAKPMINLFYSAQYGGSDRVFQILIWAIAVEIVGMNFGYGLMACDREKPYLAAVSVGALTSLILNLVLIPRWGIVGAAVTRLVTEILISAFYFQQLSKVVRLSLVRFLLKPVLAGAAVGLLSLVSGLPLIVLAPLSMLLYFCLLFVVVREEKAELLTLLWREFGESTLRT